MMACSICLELLPSFSNKFSGIIGFPPVSYGELFAECTGVEYDSSNGVCKGCCHRLLRYHDAIQIVREIKQQFTELLEFRSLRQAALAETAKLPDIVTFEAINVTDQGSAMEPKVEIEEDEVEIETVVVKEIVIDDGTGDVESDDCKTSDIRYFDDPFDDDNSQQDREAGAHTNKLPSRRGRKPSKHLWAQRGKLHQQQQQHIKIERLIAHAEEVDVTLLHFDPDMDTKPALVKIPGKHLDASSDEDNNDSAGSEYMPDKEKKGKTKTSGGGSVGLGNSESDWEFEEGKKRISRPQKRPLHGGQCPDCGKVFPTKRTYRMHLKIHVNTQGFICEVCGKTLKTRTGFTNHQQNHSGIQYPCDVCGKTYTNQVKLKHHMAWHTGLEPYQCTVCGKRFVHNKNLYTHKQSHRPDKKQIPCPQCGIKFRTNEHLKRHLAAHTGLKTHQCPICYKFFTQVYNLRVHINEHQNPGSAKQHRLRCKKCKRSFRNKDNYAEHCKANDCQREVD